MDLGPDRAVGMIPSVVHPEIDQLPQPALREEQVDVALADARGDTGHDLFIQAVPETAHGPFVNVLVAPSLIRNRRIPLDADQGGGITNLTEHLRFLRGDELPIGEDLKKAVRMLRQEVEDVRVQKGFTPQDTKEAVSVLPSIIDDAVQAIEIDLDLRFVDVHPATLAPQVAAIEDRDVKERREVNALPHPTFEEFHGGDAFEPEVPSELAQNLRIDAREHPSGEFSQHDDVKGKRGGRGPGPGYASA